MHDRIKTLRDAVGYSSSAALAQSLGLLSGFVVARLLGPTQFGVWNAVSLVLVYGAYLDLGILPAMGRDLPFYRGQGDLSRAKDIESTSRSATLVTSVLAAVVAWVLSYAPGYSPLMALGLKGMAVLIILQRLYTYYLTVLRCYNEFGLLSKLQAFFAVLSAALIILFVLWWGFTGRVTAAVLAQLVMLVWVVRLRQWNIALKLDFPLAWQLVKVGAPIIISSVVIGLLTTIDRLVVIHFLGETQLGYFGMALLITSVVSLIPATATQVLYPRITHRYGESGSNVGALSSYVLTPPLVLSCLLPVLIGPLYVLLPLIIQILLPAYVPGISAARIVLLGIFFYSVIGISDYFLVTIGKLGQYVLFAFLALALDIALDFIFLKLGYGIEGVALGGTLITYFCYAAAILGYSLSHYTRQIGDWLKFFGKLLTPFGYMLVLLLAAERWIRIPGPPGITSSLLTVGAQLALFGLGCLPLLYAASRAANIKFSLAS